MKKLLCIIIFITAANSYAQTGWYSLFNGAANKYNSVFFINANTGWIATSGVSGSISTGSLLKTTNGGLNWSASMTGSTGFTEVRYINENTGWAIGDNRYSSGARRSYIYKTTNGGITYFLQYSDSISSGATGYLMKLSVPSENNIFVLRNNNVVLRSTNSGLSFSEQTVTPGNFIDIQFADAETGWILSSFNNISKTTNSGANWYVCHAFGKMFPTCFYFINAQTGWVPVPNYGSYISTNGGEDFNYQAPVPSFTREAFFTNGSSGWICGINGSISRTTNSGLNWTAQISGGIYSAVTFYSMHFIDENTGWAVGWRNLSTDSYQSVILKTSNGGLTFIPPVSNSSPDNFSLSQNFPNPFNPETVINYYLNTSGFVKLNVYDINGRWVSTLVNRSQLSGTYSISFKGASLPSGVYFYKLETDKFTEARKMVLVK